MHADPGDAEAMASLIDEGWITEILHQVKSGKEATVYCCRGGPLAEGDHVCAKVYRPLERRAFRNDAVYQTGRMQYAHETRVHRALRKGTAAGRMFQAALWLHDEWETLTRLASAGSAVPCPLACNARTIVMEYVGHADRAAPRLHELDLGAGEAGRLVDRLVEEIELMLDCHRVHGDLSPYNVLYREGEPVIIDFPQAVDPRLNPAAE
ncbi:MAG: RIO1 family regulatory kinase/ATPase domain-containing protein, partial [Planctomycetota bacterium]